MGSIEKVSALGVRGHFVVQHGTLSAGTKSGQIVASVLFHLLFGVVCLLRIHTYDGDRTHSCTDKKAIRIKKVNRHTKWGIDRRACVQC